MRPSLPHPLLVPPPPAPRQALKKLQAEQSVELGPISINCTHPMFKGVQAKVLISIEMLPRAIALTKLVGKGRGAPNANPYLPEPVRPGLFDGLGFSFNFDLFGGLKAKLKKICCCCVIVAIVAVVVYLQMG